MKGMTEMNILVIEDEERVADIMTKYLEKEGYKVFTCYNGKSGLECFYNNKIDIVLDEVVRVHGNLQAQIDTLEKNVAELRQYYRVDKLENDNMTLMLRVVNDLVKRVEELEKRIA